MDKVAIMIDGGFYQRRANTLYGNKQTAEERADDLHKYCLRHLSTKRRGLAIDDELYRIFYYDCPPSDKKVYHPHTKKVVDLSKTELYRYMSAFHNEIKKKRKVALRLGVLDVNSLYYSLHPEVVKKLASGVRKWDSIEEADYILSIRQKGVDMRIGLDIASIAYKKQATKVILISGDSDFVPAAKLARREGIDFVLDPMGAKISLDLSEHIDGIRTLLLHKKDTGELNVE